jgi:rubrerythrin
MSALARRLQQLERTLGSCRECSNRATVELIQSGSTPRRHQPDELCPACQQPLERITVLVHFDPDGVPAA